MKGGGGKAKRQNQGFSDLKSLPVGKENSGNCVVSFSACSSWPHLQMEFVVSLSALEEVIIYTSYPVFSRVVTTTRRTRTLTTFYEVRVYHRQVIKLDSQDSWQKRRIKVISRRKRHCRRSKKRSLRQRNTSKANVIMMILSSRWRV